MANLGAMIQGGNGGRSDNRYTPREAVEALYAAEHYYWPASIWEPACGEGHISKVLEELGRTVVSTDIRETGYGRGGIDFLTVNVPVMAVITNPPFSIAKEFIEHATMISQYVAFLLKVNYFSTKGRLEMYNRLPPARIYPLTWRLDFTGQGAPPMDCSWYVWDRKRLGERIMQPLPKP